MFGIVNEPTGMDFGPLNNLSVVSSLIFEAKPNHDPLLAATLRRIG